MKNSKAFVIVFTVMMMGAALGGHAVSGKRGVSSQVPVLTAPELSDNGSFDLSWNEIGGAEIYWLNWSVDGTNWQTLGDGATESRYTVNGKSNGTYFFRLRAGLGNETYTNWSNIANTTVILGGVLPPKLTVPVTSETGAFVITWTEAFSALFYRLEYMAPGSTQWKVLDDNVNARNYAVDGLSDGIWQFRISAYLRAGKYTDMSEPVYCIVASPVGLGTPALSVNDKSLTGTYEVIWTNVEEAIYYMLAESDNADFSGAVLYSAKDTKMVFTGKGEGTYHYRVKAVSESSSGDWSQGDNVSVDFPDPEMVEVGEETLIGLHIGIPQHITVGGASHTVELVAVTEGVVEIEIRSALRRVMLELGQTMNVDIDGDGLYDMSVGLEYITNSVAGLSFSPISKPVGSGVTTESGGGVFDADITGIILQVGLLALVGIVFLEGGKPPRARVSKDENEKL